MSIELKPFYHEADVAIADGQVLLRLAIDFAVIDKLEALVGSLDEAVGQLFTSTSMQGKFLWGMTRKHHPDITLDQVAGIQFSKDGPAVMATLGNLVRNAFNIGAADEPGEGEQSRPPRKRSSGASRGSVKSGSRQASTRTHSGGRRRAAS